MQKCKDDTSLWLTIVLDHQSQNRASGATSIPLYSSLGIGFVSLAIDWVVFKLSRVKY